MYFKKLFILKRKENIRRITSVYLSLPQEARNAICIFSFAFV